LAFGENLLLRRCLACAWCHVELFLAPFTLRSCIIAGAELHLLFEWRILIAGFF
jgi:hypothetical protein